MNSGKRYFCIFVLAVLIFFFHREDGLSQNHSDALPRDLENKSDTEPMHQSDFLFDLLQEISPDSLKTYVRQLSGDTPISLNGFPDSIKTRFAKSEDISKAQRFLENKLRSFGYDVQLQEFRLKPQFGDIVFAPNDADYGWFYIDGRIYGTNDGGASWQQQPISFTLTDIKNFEAVNSNIVYAVGYYPILLKTIDGGKNWQKLNPPFYKSIYGASFVNEEKGWICGNYGNIYRTNDGGISWIKQETGTTYGIYAIDFADSLHGCAVGNMSTILRTENGGFSWEKVEIPIDVTLLTVRYFPTGQFWATGTDGILLKSSDLGKSWQADTLNPVTVLWDIDFSDSLKGLVVGNEGKIFVTQDGGNSWHQIEGITTGNCYYTDINDAGDIWITGRDVFLKSSDWFTSYQSYADDYVNTTLNNIIATRAGTISADTSVIICAHYDDYCDVENRMILAPGADDNASGSATVLEAARVLSDYDFRYTTEFVLFSGEELGLLGSRYFAAKAAESAKNIRGVINLDMIGYDGNSDGKYQIHAADVANSIQIASLIEQTTMYLMLPLQAEIISDYPTNRSDHASFWEQGFAAILMIEDMEDFNPYYHSINDLFANFNEGFFSGMADVAILSFAQLAGIQQGTNITLRDNPSLAADLYISPAYPNPFNSSASFDFHLSTDSVVKIKVFAISGQLIEEIDLGKLKEGTHHFIWNSKNLPGGIYFFQFDLHQRKFVRKAVLVR